MERLTGSLSPVTIVPVALALYVVWRTLFKASALPEIPVVGYDPKQWFGWPRALHRTWSNYRSVYREAYDKYLSQGKPCIVAELNEAHVVLPNSLSQWLVDQPDRILSASQRQNDMLQTRYTFPIPKMAEVPHHVHVIKTDLTRKLSTLSADIWDELDNGFSVYWGTDTREWKEVNVSESMLRIVGRSSNRVFVGKENCRNDRYLDLCTAFAQDVPLGGIILRMIPSLFHPILGPLITLPNRYHTQKIRNILRPEINRRLQYSTDDEDAPNDFLQWFIDYAREKLEPEESTPPFISDRIGTINFAAIHTTTFSAVNTLYDILSSPDKDMMLSMVKDEAEEILAAGGGQWTKTSVQSMVKTDSIVRESLRYSTFMTGFIQRTVVAKDGVTTPDGLHIKTGNIVEVPAWPVHFDDDIYQDPNTFMPLRFVKKSEENGAAEVSKARSGASIVDTSLSFTNFGHGRHGCPGRFFAANELKLILAFAASHYEIEPLSENPKPTGFGSFFIPDPTTTIRVRRKAASS